MLFIHSPVCIFWENVWNAPLAEWNELALRSMLTSEPQHQVDLPQNQLEQVAEITLKKKKKTTLLPPQHSLNKILSNYSWDLVR